MVQKSKLCMVLFFCIVLLSSNAFIAVAHDSIAELNCTIEESNDTSAVEKTLVATEKVTLAQQDTAEVLFQSGLEYYYGQGVTQNYSKAFILFNSAAKEDHIAAQRFVALMHCKGQGVDTSILAETAGARWLVKIAHHAKADMWDFFLAGYVIDKGYTLEKNRENDFYEAIYWYEKAAKKGLLIAQFTLAQSYAARIKVNIDTFVYWDTVMIQNVLQQKPYFIEFTLRNCFIQQAASTYQQAVYWYEQVANQGSHEAQTTLGWWYYLESRIADKEVVFKKAEYWLLQAATANYVNAQVHLGWLYVDYYFPDNQEKGMFWLTKAANQGSQLAEEILELYSGL